MYNFVKIRLSGSFSKEYSIRSCAFVQQQSSFYWQIKHNLYTFALQLIITQKRLIEYSYVFGAIFQFVKPIENLRYNHFHIWCTIPMPMSNPNDYFQPWFLCILSLYGLYTVYWLYLMRLYVNTYAHRTHADTSIAIYCLFILKKMRSKWIWCDEIVILSVHISNDLCVYKSKCLLN